MSKTLEILFQSKARVKLLKFLFRSEKSMHSIEEISKMIKEKPAIIRKEIKNFKKIGLILKK